MSTALNRRAILADAAALPRHLTSMRNAMDQSQKQARYHSPIEHRIT
jgi:hypothetical protein